MNYKFISFNGDNVGDSLGNAIASDDHNQVSKLSSTLNQAKENIVNWVSSVNGNVISSSGDEVLCQIPTESLDLSVLEGIRSQYAKDSNHTLSIGIGDSISEAAKAMIYTKLNDKNQIIEYEPAIDDYISDSEEADLPAEENIEENIEEDEKRDYDADMDDQFDESAPEDIDSGDEDVYTDDDMGEDPEEDVEGEDFDGEGEITVPAKDMVDEHEELVDTLESPDHEDDLEEADKQREELEDYKESEETGEDKYISEDDEGDEDWDDEDEQFEFDETSDRDPNEVVGDVMDSDPNDGREDDLDEVDAIDKDGDGDIDEIDMQDQTEDVPELSEEEIMQDPEAGNQQDQISDMVHSHMNGDEYQDPNEPDYSQIKQDIQGSLEMFKQNQQILEQAKQAAPELYEAMISMMRSMVSMAKLLGQDVGEEQIQEIEQTPEEEVDIPDNESPEPMEEPEIEEDPEMMEEDEKKEIPVKKQ